MKYRILLIIWASISILLLIFANSRPIKGLKNIGQQLFKAPVRASYQATTNSSSLFDTFKHIDDLVAENNSLKKENEILQARVTELGELQARLDTLQKEIGIRDSSTKKDIIVAAVVGRSPSTFQEIISIDKGSDDGVGINNPVISNGFLIGKVTSVTNSVSQVELITSHRFVAPVVFQDSRLLGLMRGGLKGLLVDQIPIDGQYKEGEKVVTSGLAGELPPGIPIGVIDKKVSKPSDIFQTVSLSVPVDLSRLEIVLVLK